MAFSLSPSAFFLTAKWKLNWPLSLSVSSLPASVSLTVFVIWISNAVFRVLSKTKIEFIRKLEKIERIQRFLNFYRSKKVWNEKFRLSELVFLMFFNTENTVGKSSKKNFYRRKGEVKVFCSDCKLDLEPPSYFLLFQSSVWVTRRRKKIHNLATDFLFGIEKLSIETKNRLLIRKLCVASFTISRKYISLEHTLQ